MFGLRGVFKSTPEGNGVDEATYDEDLVREWHVGSAGSGYDTAFSLNQNTATPFGTAATPAGVIQGSILDQAGSSIPTCTRTGGIVHMTIGIALPSRAVCDGVAASAFAARNVTGVGCVDLANPMGATDGDSALLICMQRDV